MTLEGGAETSRTIGQAFDTPNADVGIRRDRSGGCGRERCAGTRRFSRIAGSSASHADQYRRLTGTVIFNHWVIPSTRFKQVHYHLTRQLRGAADGNAVNRLTRRVSIKCASPTIDRSHTFCHLSRTRQVPLTGIERELGLNARAAPATVSGVPCIEDHWITRIREGDAMGLKPRARRPARRSRPSTSRGALGERKLPERRRRVGLRPV